MLMTTGIKAGYFLALSHLEEALEKRAKSQEERAERAKLANEPEVRSRILERRAAVLIILDMIDNHRERITKSFDFSEGGIQE